MSDEKEAISGNTNESHSEVCSIREIDSTKLIFENFPLHQVISLSAYTIRCIIMQKELAKFSQPVRAYRKNA